MLRRLVFVLALLMGFVALFIIFDGGPIRLTSKTMPIFVQDDYLGVVIDRGCLEDCRVRKYLEEGWHDVDLYRYRVEKLYMGEGWGKSDDKSSTILPPEEGGER